MKRSLYYLLFLSCLFVVSRLFVSCDKDEDGAQTSPLVGYWYDGYDGSGNEGFQEIEILIFKSDGTFLEQYWNTRDMVLNEESGTYVYNGQTKQLTTNTLVGEKPGKYTLTAKISGNVLAMLEPDGDSYSYERLTFQEYQDLLEQAV